MKSQLNVVALMAIGAGVIVANMYYVHPLLAEIARTFGISVSRAGVNAMSGQAGTAVGMFPFVPLGDVRERRRLILTLIGVSFFGLIAAAMAPSATALSLAMMVIGCSGAAVHVIVPFAGCCLAFCSLGLSQASSERTSAGDRYSGSQPGSW